MPWINRYRCQGCAFTADISSEVESFTPQRDDEADCRYCPQCLSAYAFPRGVEKRFMQSWLEKHKQWRQRSEFREFVIKEIEAQLDNVELYAIFYFFLPTISCPTCCQQLLSRQIGSSALWCIRCNQLSLLEVETICHYQAFVENPDVGP